MTSSTTATWLWMTWSLLAMIHYRLMLQEMRGLNPTESPWVRTHFNVIICQNRSFLLRYRSSVSSKQNIALIPVLQSIWTANCTDKIKISCPYSYVYCSYIWGWFRFYREFSLFLINSAVQCHFMGWDKYVHERGKCL